MSKEIYIFNQDLLNLKNGNAENIIIKKGFSIEFVPEYKKEEDKKNYKVILTNADGYGHIEKMFSIRKDLAEKLVSKSKKLIIKEDLPLFTIDEVAEQITPLFKRMVLHVEQINKYLEVVDISANSTVVSGHVSKLSAMFKDLENVNFHKLNDKQAEAINFFNKEPVELVCDQVNVALTSIPYKFIKPIEIYANSFLDDSLHWLNNLDSNMGSAKLNDFIDVLKISTALNKGRLHEAYDATSLDTYVREGLPEKFWNDWVLIVGIDKETLKKQQEEFKKAGVSKPPKIK